jgi:hypothetical protein
VGAAFAGCARPFCPPFDPWLSSIRTACSCGYPC